MREGGFYPQSLEKGIRSEQALLLILAEMYVQSISTRKVAAITEKLCGTQVSASQVSRATQLLDEELEAWGNRPLGEVIYLYLDARYEKVRQAGSVRAAARKAVFTGTVAAIPISLAAKCWAVCAEKGHARENS